MGVDGDRLFYPTPWPDHARVKSIPVRHYAAAAFACLLVIGGVAAIWAGFGLAWRTPCGWMALVAALDAAVLMRLAGFPAGSARARIALAATALSIPVGAFVVAAVVIGVGFGTLPHEAIWRIGPDMAATWWRLNGSLWDVLAMIAALPLAWRMGR